MMLSLPHTHAVHGSLLLAAARSHSAQGKTACGFPQPPTPLLSGHGAALPHRDPTAQLLQRVLNVWLSHVGLGMKGWAGQGCWWHSIGVTTAHPQHPPTAHTGSGIAQPCASRCCIHMGREQRAQPSAKCLAPCLQGHHPDARRGRAAQPCREHHAAPGSP